MKKILLLVAALSGLALAHTEITHLTPADGSTVAAPKTVTLNFSEPINLRFSTFKVYPLSKGTSAAALAAAKLRLKSDAKDRADRFPGLSGLAAKVSLPLKAPLKAGPYVLMWRILSDDGHIVSGQATFTVK